MANPTPITFLIPGAVASPADTTQPHVRSVRLAATARGAGTLQRLQAIPGEDTVVITLGNGQGPDLKLRLHPENARALLLAQAGPAGAAARGAGDVALEPGAVQVPINAQWQGMGGANRGGVSDLVFKALDLVGLDPRDTLAKLAAAELGKRLDGQVNEGVYALKQTELGSLNKSKPVPIQASAEPTLVLIHGTFVDTDSTFGKWWVGHSGLVAQLFQHYAGRVYALDHGTVMRSPIANALVLAEALPQGARLHLVTHSRGGLMAEVLLRASRGVTDADLAVFEGAAYEQHRLDLAALGRMLHSKQVTVERIVRVACPAYGTLLASNRLDAYLSALAWLMERVGLPVLPELVRFADAIARERAKPESLPGIEAMRRSSAVVRWINGAATAAPSTLRVVAGDIAGDSLVSWVKTLLADSYYWTDNDLVVQTSSMYGGMARVDEASFLLDRSGSTDHFSYFKNDRTANGIAQALIQEHPDGFSPIGPLSRAGLHASGTRGAPVALGDGSLPAVIVLPGIVGSNLKRGDTREWLAWWRLFGMMERIDIDEPGVSEDGPVESYYNDLIDHLRTSHEVVPFGYDWRVSLSASAALLAQCVQQLLDSRATSHQPVRVLAHSMGSMVLRVMQLEHPAVWQAMLAIQGARVLLLGPPNSGSWAPMSIYTGDDNFGRLLSTVGGAFHEQTARQKMAKFPGLLQLQAGLTDPAAQLSSEQWWRQMGDKDFNAALASRTWHDTDEQVAAYRWAIPSQADLDQAASLRRQLDVQLPALLADASKLTIVLGQAPDTPCGLAWDDRGMHYLSTAEGDGRVTWEAACLPGVATWKTDQVHGDLPKVKANFDAYVELLTTGRTTSSSVTSWTTRGAQGTPTAPRATRTLPRLRDNTQPGDATPVSEQTLLAAAMGSLPTGGAVPDLQPGGPVLTVEVLNGDLKFIREALLLGHSRSLALTGSEWVVNGLMGNALQEALALGLYPDQVGQHQIFINQYATPENPFALPRPQAAIVVGLGDESELQPALLAAAVRQAVLAYQRHLAKPADGEIGVTLAATTLGSGGNLSIGQSVTALLQGVQEANARLADASPAVRWPRVTRLQVVELFHNRALEAWHTLRAAINAGAVSAVLLPHVRAQNGARSQPPGGHYRGTDYDLIRISQKLCALGASQVELEFSVNTMRARSEGLDKVIQRGLVAALVAAAESNTRFDADLARSLFQLLLPHELKAHLGMANTLVFEVDADTAGYPWEMVDDSDGQQALVREPWALRLTGALVRKMFIKEFRRQPIDAQTDDVLVVGAPKLDATQGMPDLPGARAEAKAVAALLASRAEYSVELLLDSDFLNIVKPALARPWKVIHMAGHGVYDAAGGKSGMLMSGGLVFGPTEFESMPTVPELVFVNCCHLGKTENVNQPRHTLFAANVAEQLMRNGVRCVVAAGWAVDDDAAQAFAEGFYGALQSGRNFAEAVKAARRKAYGRNSASNTWAAYQCYGDPTWTLRRRAAKDDPLVQSSKTPVVPTQRDLLLALEAIKCDAQGASEARGMELRDKLNQLVEVSPAEWKACGAVAEALGLTWRDAGDKAKAIAWLEVAVNAADGTASLVAREQQLNMKARQPRVKRAELKAVIKDIEALMHMAPTAERYSILGSAHKRMVMGDDKVSTDQLKRDLDQMRQAYGAAERMEPSNLFYALMQRCMAQLRLHWLDPANPAPSAQDMATVRRSLALQDAQNPDFWSVVGHQEVQLLEGLIAGNVAAYMDGILAGLNDLHQRVRNPHFWASVHDTAKFLLSAYVNGVTTSEAERSAARQYLERVASYM